MNKKRSYLQKYKEWLEWNLNNHKGKWLTMEAVTDYRKRTLQLPNPSGSLVGEKRKLFNELIEEYGVTELEATNILNGCGGQDYVLKYERIKKQIPIYVNMESLKIEENWKKLDMDDYEDLEER